MLGNNYKVLDLNEDVQVQGSYEGLEMECPRCKRVKPMSFFFEEQCDCGLEMEFKIKAFPPQDDQEKGGWF